MRHLATPAVLAALTCSVFAAAAPTSEFTSTDISKARNLDNSPTSGSYLFPGFGGYKILLSRAEGRSWVDVVSGPLTVQLRDQIAEACPGANPWKANNVVQWRGYRKGNQFTPYALIFRMLSENELPKQKPHDTLVVVKLDGQNTRVVGQVRGNTANGNTAAEQLADKLCASSDGAASAPAPEDGPAPVSTARPTPEASSNPEQGDASGVSVLRLDDGTTTLRFSNGQTFKLPPGKGLLGPSDNPTAGKPFVCEGGWLVVANEIPATKTSFVHIYLKGKNGRWTELPNVQQRLLKIAKVGGTAFDSEFVRVNSAGIGWPGTALLRTEFMPTNSREPREMPIGVSRTGNISYGSRGE